MPRGPAPILQFQARAPASAQASVSRPDPSSEATAISKRLERARTSASTMRSVPPMSEDEARCNTRIVARGGGMAPV